jgi:hypothetical protein
MSDTPKLNKLHGREPSDSQGQGNGLALLGCIRKGAMAEIRVHMKEF